MPTEGTEITETGSIPHRPTTGTETGPPRGTANTGHRPPDGTAETAAVHHPANTGTKRPEDMMTNRRAGTIIIDPDRPARLTGGSTRCTGTNAATGHDQERIRI